MSIPDGQRRTLLAGATGLVGGQILEALLEDGTVSQVLVLSRRALVKNHPKLQVLLVDFRQLPEVPEVDEVYLSLGTTIKVAGSQAAFRAVDLEANLGVMQAAWAAGARRVGLVSSVGANSKSTVFYNRVKGELEDALKAMDLKTLVIAQPSLLLGERDQLGQPPRLGEKLGTPIMKFFSPILPGIYQPVSAQAVAKTLVKTVPTATGPVVLASDVLAQTGAANTR